MTRRTFRRQRDTTEGAWVITDDDPARRLFRMLCFLAIAVFATLLTHVALTDPAAFTERTGRGQDMLALISGSGLPVAVGWFAYSFVKRRIRRSDFDSAPEMQQLLDRAVAGYALRLKDVESLPEDFQAEAGRTLSNSLGVAASLADTVRRGRVLLSDARRDQALVVLREFADSMEDRGAVTLLAHPKP